jgi:hypothetical protein
MSTSGELSTEGVQAAPLAETLSKELDAYIETAAQQFRAHAAAIAGEVWHTAAAKATEQITRRLKVGDNAPEPIFPTEELLKLWQAHYFSPQSLVELSQRLPSGEFVIACVYEPFVHGRSQPTRATICTNMGRMVTWHHTTLGPNARIMCPPCANEIQHMMQTPPFPLTYEMCELVRASSAPEIDNDLGRVWRNLIELFRKYHPSVPDLANVVRRQEQLAAAAVKLDEDTKSSHAVLLAREAEIKANESKIAERLAALDTDQQTLARERHAATERMNRFLTIEATHKRSLHELAQQLILANNHISDAMDLQPAVSGVASALRLEARDGIQAVIAALGK